MDQMVNCINKGHKNSSENDLINIKDDNGNTIRITKNTKTKKFKFIYQNKEQ